MRKKRVVAAPICGGASAWPRRQAAGIIGLVLLALAPGLVLWGRVEAHAAYAQGSVGVHRKVGIEGPIVGAEGSYIHAFANGTLSSYADSHLFVIGPDVNGWGLFEACSYPMGCEHVEDDDIVMVMDPLLNIVRVELTGTSRCEGSVTATFLLQGDGSYARGSGHEPKVTPEDLGLSAEAFGAEEVGRPAKVVEGTISSPCFGRVSLLPESSAWVKEAVAYGLLLNAP